MKLIRVVNSDDKLVFFKSISKTLLVQLAFNNATSAFGSSVKLP